MLGVVSYLGLTFQLSALGLVYHFPDVACIRVPQRLLLRAVTSFSQVYGSSGCRAVATFLLGRYLCGTYIVEKICQGRACFS